MIRLQEPDQLKPTEFAPAMDEGTGILPGLPPVAGKPVHLTFDGGRMTSDAGILLLAAIEQRLGIAERLADCIEDRRDPDRVLHGLAEMIRYRAMLIAAGYPDGNDCDALRSDPAFKMAVGRLPESGDDLCSQPSISRLENLPGPVALKRMMAAMVELFCDSFEQVPRRILLDIDDTEDRVHGGQQLALFNAHYDSRCFLPIHIYEATTGKPVAIILRGYARTRRRSKGLSISTHARPTKPAKAKLGSGSITAFSVGEEDWLTDIPQPGHYDAVVIQASINPRSDITYLNISYQIVDHAVRPYVISEMMGLDAKHTNPRHSQSAQ